MDQQLINEKQQENSAMEPLNLWLWVEALCLWWRLWCSDVEFGRALRPKGWNSNGEPGWKSRQALHWGNVWDMHEYAFILYYIILVLN